MNPTFVHRSAAVITLLAGAFYVGCGDSAATGPTGETCKAASDCYVGVDPATLSGPIACLSVTDGYCTHTCATDADCCSAKGECPGGHAEVCSPFESTGKMYCLLSCESTDVGSEDPNAYCGQFANAAFTCRSSGGGAKNRKICSP